MRKMYNNPVEIERMLQFLDIQEVTTSTQKKNGTREFKLPVKCQYGGAIHVASFASGYVRRTKAGGHCPSWQLNKRVESEIKHYGPFEDGTYREYTTRTCKLIPNEQDRLAYLISFCLKNYYIGYANKLSNGEFVAKWKYEDDIKNAVVENTTPEVKVIVNGQRYNVI
tara:strand:+ start:125 stop:628 length:504 start_codon:yes stop_codon:yes gene_type:complete